MNILVDWAAGAYWHSVERLAEGAETVIFPEAPPHLEKPTF